MLTLYTAPGTCALASHIALEQAGADYALQRVDFKSTQQRSPEYLKLNPKGRVPALVTEHGVLTETPAILLYIAQRFPEAQLAPFDDPWALAQLNAFCSYLCSTVHVAHAHGRRGARWADDPAAWEAMKAKVPQTVGDGFALIENELFKGPWVMGERSASPTPTSTPWPPGSKATAWIRRVSPRWPPIASAWPPCRRYRRCSLPAADLSAGAACAGASPSSRPLASGTSRTHRAAGWPAAAAAAPASRRKEWKTPAGALAGRCRRVPSP